MINGARGMRARCPNPPRTVRKNSTMSVSQSSNLSRAAHSNQSKSNSKMFKLAGPPILPAGRPFSADALTSREHHNDCENHFIVSDGGDVAKAHRAEPGKDKVQGGAVAALWKEGGGHGE